MEQNLQKLLEQADELKNGIKQMQDESKMMGYNSVGIRENAEIIQKCLKKVGNNKIAALANRDKRKVYDQMEDAVEQLMELIK
jgi:primosomal protein N''